MAFLYPDLADSRVIFSSRAEEQLYKICSENLSDSRHVFYSITLSKHELGEGIKDNEIDFVVYHPLYGLIVIEVKGGRIGFDAKSAAFFSINRHDERFDIKDPFKQALVWKSRFLRYLRLKNLRLPVSHAICFPSVDESEFPESAGFEQRIILGRNRIQKIEESLIHIATSSHAEKYLHFTDVKDTLKDILIGSSFTSRLYLRDYIDSHELRVRDIEGIHESLIMPIASSQRLGVEGEAGTGKTILAILLAKHFRDQGQKVCLLSSNNLLNLYLKKEVGPGVTIKTYNEIASGFGVNLLHPHKDFSGKRNDWVQIEGPSRLKDKIDQSLERYDVLICDEAQDVQPLWWEAIKSLLKDENARFYLFFDRSQGVFGSGEAASNFIPDEVLPVPGPYFPLVHNYRNTREIASFARSFRTGKAILQSHSGRLGYKPEIVVYKDKSDFDRSLGGLLRKLRRDEKIRLNEITLLSARAPQAKGSVLFQTQEIAKTPLFDFSRHAGRHKHGFYVPEHKLSTATIAGFKGLETPIGILLNISEYHLPIDNPIMSNLIYVAFTRAKHMLYIFVREDDPKRLHLENALKLVNSSGSMVIEGSQSDFEFSGIVSYYNPDRMGWLTVDDPAFQRKNIMFFPSDITKAGIQKLELGESLIFRTQVEGSAIVANVLKKGRAD